MVNFLTGSGGLAGVDVSDDNDVDMHLFFTVQAVSIIDFDSAGFEQRLTPSWRLLVVVVLKM